MTKGFSSLKNLDLYRFLETKFIFRCYSILLVTECDFVAKTIKCKTIIIFNDDYFSSLILPYSNENIFITNTIHRNTYSDYRLIKLTPKFPSTGAHFSYHNSDKNYFSSLNVLIFFIISDKIHILSLKL